jgi:D-amino-acid dehydrogenase
VSKRVVIVGGGVIGLCAAYYCARNGCQVTLVERHSASRDGASFGNAGMIVPSHFVPLAAPGMVALGLKWMWNPASPLYIKPRLDAALLSWAFKFCRAANRRHVQRAAPLLRDLSLASRAGFEELAALPGNDFAFTQQGLLMLCKDPHTLAEESRTAAQARELGIPAEVLDATQTAALDPQVQMAIAGSVYFPKDCHLSPNRFMSVLQNQVQQLGGSFRWDTEVTDWRLENPRRIRALRLASGEEIEGDEFVLGAGSWSPGLARKLGLRLPMQAGKGYSLTLPRPRQLPRICSILTEARVAVTPMNGALRVGGTLEIAGLNEEINPIRVRRIVESFCRYFPAFTPVDFETVAPWKGLRPCSPDGMPYIGRTRRFDNLTIATGHSMMGLSLGPITGRLVGMILAGEKAPWDLSMLSPDRYG